MNAKDVIRYNTKLGHSMTTTYLSDMTDAELMQRPVPGANHIKWQLGHLIVSERGLLRSMGAKMPELPEGFEPAHSRDNTACDDVSKFWPKQTYLDLMQQMHEAAMACLADFPDAKLSEPGPEATRSYLPTNMAVFNMTGSHEIMHVGQIAVLRRKLGKPVVI